MYLYLLFNKVEALDTFKTYKVEIVKQKEKKTIKIEGDDIITQYIMLDTLQQKGVAERRNCTFMDMIRSMIGNSNLSLPLWSEALKTIVCILNRISFKAMSKISFKLKNGWMPSLNHTLV
jgi:hypothetical protein